MRPSLVAQFAHLDVSPIVRIIRNKIALLGIFGNGNPPKRPLEDHALINEKGAPFGGEAAEGHAVGRAEREPPSSTPRRPSTP